MDKLNMQTKNLADENYAALAKLFPNALTETIVGYDENGKAIVERAIDVDVLRQEISCSVVEGKDERYQFTWPAKKKAVLLANAPINKTLRPDVEESIEFANTKNLYIEGDNLDVIKLLHETYLSKVKVIYIDPPYNTGNDFLYEDNFVEDLDEYIIHSGQLDEDGNRLVQNAESNGRFHTDWLNMMYSRLRLAKDLLCDDGIIFISIDDNEVGNLLKICDEIFGRNCFVGNICRATGTTTAQGTESLGKSFDYVVAYSKQPNFKVGGFELSEKDAARYSYEDEKGKFSILQLRRTGGEDRREDRPSMYFGIETPDGKVVYPKGPTGYDSRWRVGQDTYNQMLKDNLIYFKETDDGYAVYYKFYLEGRTKRPSNLWTEIEGNKKAQIDLKSLIPEKVFETPKPLELIINILQVANVDENSIIMDFFSGSGTTGEAVIKWNSERMHKCKYILVQVPEKTEEGTGAYKAGYKTICDIGKERLRRAAKKYKSGDCGFRVLKVDSSNMKDVYYNPVQIQQHTLFESTDNIKEDRTPEDLLFQVMLDLGVLLSSKIEETVIAGKKVFNVADGFLMACFDNNVTEEVVKAVAQQKPYYAVFRDSSMANDSVATNFEQIFATYSPETVRRVL